MNILKLLDEQIDGFQIKTGDYPTKIIMSKETHNKVKDELNKITDLDTSWKDIKLKNYRGIKIILRAETFIELE